MPCPPIPVHIAAYLVDRAQTGRSLSTIKHARAAVAHAHKEAGMPDPCKNEGVRRVLRGLSRQAAEAGRVSKQAAALTAEALAAIRATALRPRTGPTGRTESKVQAERRGLVDIALCSLMRDALLRRSETVALRWQDVEFHASDGTGRLHIRRSKTIRREWVMFSFLHAKPSRALRKIMPAEYDPEANVFGMTAGTIRNRIASAARAAGLEGRSPDTAPASEWRGTLLRLDANCPHSCNLAGGNPKGCPLPTPETNPQDVEPLLATTGKREKKHPMR